MAGIKGYPDQNKMANGKMQHVTVSPIREGQHGLDVFAHIATQEIVVDDVVEAGSTTKIVNATAHSAQVGDRIYFSNGTNATREVSVEAVDTNTITLAETLPVAPGTGDLFTISRFKPMKVDAGGGISASLSFLRDGGNQIVTEDTGTPANNRPLPVKITGLDGDVVINSSNLNLAVQLDHSSANPDSVQIGDGTETLAINADGSAQVRNVEDHNYGAVGADTLRTAAQLGNASGAADFGSGVVSAQTVRNTPATDSEHLLATRHEAVGTPLSARLSDGTSFIAVDFGASSGGLRVASLLGNASGLADFGAGAVSAQSVRTTPASDSEHLLNTRHETVTTPLAGRLSDGTDFISSEALAAAQKTISTLTKMLATASVVMGWDGTDHRELAVTTDGELKTSSPEGRSAVDDVRNDYTSTNVTTGAWVELIASTSAESNWLSIFDSSGQTLEIGTGAAASEAHLFYITPGGVDLPIKIASGTRVSVRAVSANATVGELVLTTLS